jgi:integrase
MASIYVRGGKLWINYRYQDEKKPRREPLGLDDSPEGWKIAETKRLEKELEIRRKVHKKAQGLVLFTDAFASFIREKKKDTNHVHVYEDSFKAFRKYFGANKYLTSLSESDWKDLKNHLLDTKAHNTTSTYMAHLKTFMDYVIKNKLDNNFFQGLNPVPRVSTIKMPIRVIPKKHYDLIIKNLRQNKYPELYCYFIEFLYLSGFRRSEALRCKWEHFHFDRNILNIWTQKGGRFDVFPLYPSFKKFILKLKKVSKSETLFPIEVRALDFFPRLCKKLNLPVYGLHDLRRTFGTNMAKVVNVYELQKLMRHNDIRTTMRYYVDTDMSEISKKLK